jgi:soluble lytic murein transglycosylase
MIRNRLFLLLFLLACLLRSTALFSKNEAVADSAATNSSAPIQLSMLSETEGDDLRTGKVTRTNSVEDDVQQSANDSAQSVSETAVENQFTDEELEQLRKLFLQAENAIKRGKDSKYFSLADQLEEYPLYPYLQYQWLRKNIGSERQVKHFLQEHESSRYASRLKRKWLYNLAKNKQWETFLQYFSTTSDKSLNCYYHRAQFKTGDKQAAIEGAKKLWAVGYSQPKVCDPLFTQLKKSSAFNQELFWLRFDAALQNNKTKLAKYVKSLMTAGDQKTADLWLNLHRNPERYIPELLSRPETAQAPLMFTHAINRLARKDVYQAIDLWDNNKQRFDISKQPADKLEERLALKLAYKNDSDAYERLAQLNESEHSSKAWRIRVALHEQNWPRIIAAIKDLSPENQKLEKWQYWLARAYQETGKPIQAHELLSGLSTKRDFYGYLAADRLNREYQLAHNPLEVTAEEIAGIKNHKEFQAAFEFMMLDREKDAKLQWWHALRQLDKSEYPAAAKLAQQWQWDEVAIFTIAKVKYWDDVELRFPLSYSDKIHENAVQQDLNPVILYGLIRRESAFNKDARSPSGAVGLMQIMPRTGQQIAKDLNERWSGKKSLYDPVKNLKYGSYYYQKLLNQFNGHYALALAAYNAGPNRVKKWLPTEAVPADIWIETIPFRETREYVATVLVYAMIYQQRIQSDELTMADLTREVQPLIDVALAK